jgi:hypothetical protein
MDERERILDDLLPETTKLLCDAMSLKLLIEKYDETDPEKAAASRKLWNEYSDRFVVIWPQVKILMDEEIESLRKGKR